MRPMKPYPSVLKKTLDSIYDVVQFIVRQRDSDAANWNNLQFTFISGRKVAKIPSSSVDVVVPEDRVGDFNVTATYAYYLIDNGGTAVWRRVAVGAW